MSSRAQTCCGHPVRPFTFFSVPKDSCRPSVCDTRNTPNYHHHHHQQQEEEEEATNKPPLSGLSLPIITFPAAAQDKPKAQESVVDSGDFRKSSGTAEPGSPHVRPKAPEEEQRQRAAASWSLNHRVGHEIALCHRLWKHLSNVINAFFQSTDSIPSVVQD